MYICSEHARSCTVSVHTQMQMDATAGHIQWLIQFSIHLDRDKVKNKQTNKHTSSNSAAEEIFSMTTHRLTYIHSPLPKENRGWCEKVVVTYNTAENTWLWVKDEKAASVHPWPPFSRGFRERGRCLLVWPLRKDWVPLGEKEGQKRFSLSLGHFETVFNTCSVSLCSQDWHEDSWWGQKMAEHSTNTMAMGQYWILRYSTDPWEIFRDFLSKNIIFLLCQEGWSLQIRELNFSTAPEKFWPREEPFSSPGGLGSTQSRVPSSRAACGKHSSSYRDWNV